MHEIDMTEAIVHKLKAWPEFYWPVVEGNKPFEIRKDDREYKVGAYIRLHEWDPVAEVYTGQVSGHYKITYITDFEQKPDYVVLGIKLVYLGQAHTKSDRTIGDILQVAKQDLGESLIQ